MKPKTILKIFGLVLYAVILVLSYFYQMFLIPAGIILVVAVIWFVIAKIRAKRRRAYNVPEDLLTEMQTAEKIWVDNEGKIEPHEILWNLHRQNYASLMKTDSKDSNLKGGNLNNGNRQGQANSRTGIRNSSTEPLGRQNMEDNSEQSVGEDVSEAGRYKRKHNKTWRR